MYCSSASACVSLNQGLTHVVATRQILLDQVNQGAVCGHHVALPFVLLLRTRHVGDRTSPRRASSHGTSADHSAPRPPAGSIRRTTGRTAPLPHRLRLSNSSVIRASGHRPARRPARQAPCDQPPRPRPCLPRPPLRHPTIPLSPHGSVSTPCTPTLFFKPNLSHNPPPTLLWVGSGSWVPYNAKRPSPGFSALPPAPSSPHTSCSATCTWPSTV